MSLRECFTCSNTDTQQFITQQQSLYKNNTQLVSTQSIGNINESIIKQNSSRAQNNDNQQNQIFLRCSCCDNIYCKKCIMKHVYQWKILQKSKFQFLIDEKVNHQQMDIENIKMIEDKITFICQQCQQQSSQKHCESCQQYLCQKCSFKIHNKGKRAKHQLDTNIKRNILVQKVVLLTIGLKNHLKQIYGQISCITDSVQKFFKEQLQISLFSTLFLLDENNSNQLSLNKIQNLNIKQFNSDSISLDYILSLKNKYPMIKTCNIYIFSKQVNFYKTMKEQSQKSKGISVNLFDQYKKYMIPPKHVRVFSQKHTELPTLKHNKNISNFSNLSAISKIQHQSIISNEQSDLFLTNQLSENNTLNQTSSILMMGNLSDCDKQQRQQKKLEFKQFKQLKQISKPNNGHHRIYSIRQQNSHNSGNNISSSTQNSLKKRSKKWPIPYFQAFRTSKYDSSSKLQVQNYMRQLAQKGILMIRKQKAQQFLLDPDITRTFIRNIGEKQIEYVAYIIQYISVQCLTWIIQSIKQDKMTPSQKLIQSRLKQSFQLKVNLKIWDSVIKYLQSPQYEEDYYQNGKNRYIPKISVVKYGEQFLLQFEQRRWAYEDQELLDQQEEEWIQFKKLISDYFNDNKQITGGRYGCVQYVKLNGPKPLRKCSLGKISLYVQEAINKGIIRYHKTLLVSNTQNNTSLCSNGQQQLVQTSIGVQIQKQIKIISIQVALINMFLQVPVMTPISLAQIPLNLKKSILFDYTLVQLGFPKLKNILSTLQDKLILETTKTHITYQVTTNGLQAIQKQRNRLKSLQQNFLIQIQGYIRQLITYLQAITIDQLYNQLNIKLGYVFDYKIFNLPDFNQFILCYCQDCIHIQLANGIFVAYCRYQYYPNPQINQIHQTHRSTYSQNDYSYTPTYDLQYDPYNTNYSKTVQKKNNYSKPQLQSLKLTRMGSEQLDSFGTSSMTPKFNNNISNPPLKQKFDDLAWTACYEQSPCKKQQAQQQGLQQNSRQIQHIINILDDGDVSASHPKTVIVNQAKQQNQFYNFPNYKQDSSDLFAQENWNYLGADQNQKNSKAQHTRFRSTNQLTTKHSRQYSTANPRK